MDILNASNAGGANVQQYTWNGSDAQLWKFVDAGNGMYYVRSKLGTVLGLSTESAAAGTNVLHAEYESDKFKEMENYGI